MAGDRFAFVTGAAATELGGGLGWSYLAAPAGLRFVITAAAGELVLEVLPVSSYETWIDAYRGTLPKAADRLPGADPDGDGASNLAEFAFNGAPDDGSDRGLFAIVIQDTSAPVGDELTLVIAVRNGAVFGSGNTATSDGLTYTTQGSLDLAAWGSTVTHVAGPTTTAPGGSGLTEDLTATAWKYHTFKLDASEGLPAKGFLRAKVEN